MQPLRDAAEVLAEHEGWPPLYDVARLRANTVPVVGTMYWDDEYVERTMALGDGRAARQLQPLDHQRVRARCVSRRPEAGGGATVLDAGRSDREVVAVEPAK